MRILLIQPSNNMDELLGRGKIFVHATEPLGILYIAAVLEKNGFAVDVLDAFGLEMGFDAVKAVLNQGRWDAVGISCITSNGAFTYYLGKWLKSNFPDVWVILGNIHASVYADFYLRHRAADVVVHGEGEYTTLQLLEAIRQGRELGNIPNISWFKEGAVITNASRPAAPNLDELPLPARHLVDMNRYTSRDFVTRTRGAYRVMFSSRGCAYNCTFCVVHQKKNYRMRAPEAVVDEMALLCNRYHAGFIEFLDPLFTVKKSRVVNICRLIRQRRIKVAWQCEAHVNTIDREMLEEMKAAGCINIAYGIESGVQVLLDRIGKKSTLERIRNVIELTADSGIHALGLFMIGIPGETKAMTRQTIQFAKSLPLHYAQFAITVPYPGSQMYDDLVDKGELVIGNDPDQVIRNWLRYSTYISFTDNEPIYVPHGRTGEELKKFQKQAIRDFYLRPRHIFNEIRKFKLSNWRDYITGVREVFLK